MKKIVFLIVMAMLGLTTSAQVVKLYKGDKLIKEYKADEVDRVVFEEAHKSSSLGLYVLNEGNYYSGIDGSLSYLDYSTERLTDGLFQVANGRSLGGTPNDMIEVNGRVCICVTDENRLEIIDSNTRKSVSFAKITQPREVCASGDGIYVSSYDGTVTMFDFEGKKLAKSEKVGECLEGITVRDGYVYVCNAYNADYTYNTNVVKLEEGTLKKVKDITVACNPTQIEFDGGLMYVLSTGNYADVQAQIQTIDDNDNVKYLCDATMMGVDGNTVYAINSVTDWSTYTTTTEYFKIEGVSGTKSSILSSLDTQEIASPCAIAVDKYNQYIYVSSYSMGASGYADYSGNGYIMQFKYDGNFVKRYDAGVGPTTLVPYIVQVN